MSFSAPFSSPPVSQMLTTAVVTLNQRTPFTVDSPVRVWSPSAQTIYGAKHPGVTDTTNYARLKLPVQSANVAYTVPTTLTAMDNQAIAGLTDANRMRVILVKNGTTVMVRVGNDATCTAGQFQQTNTTTIKVGDAVVAGDVFELFVLDAADIITLTGGATTAGRVYDSTCYTFMTATGVTNMIAGV